MNMNEQSAANVTTYHVDMKRMMNNKQLFSLIICVINTAQSSTTTVSFSSQDIMPGCNNYWSTLNKRY